MNPFHVSVLKLKSKERERESHNASKVSKTDRNLLPNFILYTNILWRFTPLNPPTPPHFLLHHAPHSHSSAKLRDLTCAAARTQGSFLPSSQGFYFWLGSRRRWRGRFMTLPLHCVDLLFRRLAGILALMFRCLVMEGIAFDGYKGSDRAEGRLLFVIICS